MLKNYFKISAIIIFLVSITSIVNANNAYTWLKNEIDYVIDVYKDENITNIERFNFIEDTINKNFAGAGIAKFVAGKAWQTADQDTKKKYIVLFKRYLVMSIDSLLQAFSNQEYKLTNSNYDQKNKLTMVDMEIFNDTGSLLITWRVKETKDRYFIIDYLVANISFAVSKRSEFNSLLKTTNYNLKEFNNSFSRSNETGYNDLMKNSTILSTEETKPAPPLSIKPFSKPKF